MVYVLIFWQFWKPVATLLQDEWGGTNWSVGSQVIMLMATMTIRHGDGNDNDDNNDGDSVVDNKKLLISSRIKDKI